MIIERNSQSQVAHLDDVTVEARCAIISVKRDRLVNLILPGWLSIAAYMTGLTTLLTGIAGLFGFRWLDIIRGWWLGRIGRILGKFDYLVSKSGVGSEKFGNLFFQGCDSPVTLLQLSFKFSNTSPKELFSPGCQFLPSNYLIWLLSGERGPPLEERSIVSLNYNFEYVTK